MTRRAGRTMLAAAAALALAACARAPAHKDNDVRVAIYANPSSLSLIGNTDLNSAQLSSGWTPRDSTFRWSPALGSLRPTGRL